VISPVTIGGFFAMRNGERLKGCVVKVANHLYCGAKVVGGHQEALNFLENNKDDFKIRKFKRNTRTKRRSFYCQQCLLISV
jgi:hypothetical protein